MEAKLFELIREAIEEAQKQVASREMSLVITKLQEAMLWYGVQRPSDAGL